MSLTEWAREYGLKTTTLYQRIHRNGLSIGEALVSIRDLKRKRFAAGYFEHNGRCLPLKEWAAEYGVSHARTWARLKLGWSLEKALSTPARVGKYSSSRKSVKE